MSTMTTTTTRDRGDRYGPMEWAQLAYNHRKTNRREASDGTWMRDSARSSFLASISRTKTSG